MHLRGGRPAHTPVALCGGRDAVDGAVIGRQVPDFQRPRGQVVAAELVDCVSRREHRRPAARLRDLRVLPAYGCNLTKKNIKIGTKGERIVG